MKVIVKFQTKWRFPNEWLESFKNEFARQVPHKKIWLTVENRPNADYIIITNGAKGKTTVRLNTFFEGDITTIFEKGYLKAVVEHEAKHLQPSVRFKHEALPAPESILMTDGVESYNELTDKISLKFQDFLCDVYANSAMTNENLKKYLEFEIYKIKVIWNDNKNGLIRTPLLVFTSYIEACYTSIGEQPPEEFLVIANNLHNDASNIAIYKQMLETYLTMWNIVKSGQKEEIDLTKQTYVLNELLQRQQNPFL
jgi:hypothetical protein